MQEKEFDVAASEEAGDVVVVEAVDVLKIPGYISSEAYSKIKCNISKEYDPTTLYHFPNEIDALIEDEM